MTIRFATQIITLFAHLALSIIVFVWDKHMPAVHFGIFSIAFYFMFYIAIFKNKILAVTFFSVFLYLGFYAKICLHSFFVYPFVEPIGAFTGTLGEWKDFFIISSVGAITVGAVTLLSNFVVRPGSLEIRNEAQAVFFPLFDKYRVLYFFGILLLILTIAYVNITLGINISGLAAATILPWPMNALIGFSFYMGFVVLIALFAEAEVKNIGTLNLTYILVFFEGLASSVAILSRGTFLFHFIPFFLCVYVIRKQIRLTYIKSAILLGAGCLTFLLSGYVVTAARSNAYDGYVLEETSYNSKNIYSLNSLFLNEGASFKVYSQQLLRLIVDRWVGAEGLMAVIAYPQKDVNLIFESLKRVPKVGEKDIFERMNGSFYPDSSKYVFTSMPGPIAFFSYAGSVYVVLIGMFIFISALCFLQVTADMLAPSPFFKYQTGFYLALAFAQFGLSPRPLLISFFMYFSLLTVVAVVKKIRSSKAIYRL